MRRVASVWAAVAAAVAFGGCGESRSAAAPFGPTGCTNCHSGPGEAPPFRDTTGSTDPGQVTVGAHDAHLHGALSAPISCNECHTAPRAINDPGHLEESPDDLRFGPLATTGGTAPTYAQPTCSAVYCHGGFPGGNADNAPRWVGPPDQAACGTCHVIPEVGRPASGRHAAHVGVSSGGTAITCNTCHGPLVPETHVNGVKNVTLPVWQPATRTCAAACHDSRGW
jgi:predicted CxxxxCH...CXXCH cytochrome family protein